MVLTGQFEDLFSLFIFAQWIFYALAVASVYGSRRKEPDLVRPYRAWGYPIVPGIFRSRGFRPHRESVHPAPRPIHDWSAPDSRGPPLLSALEASQLSCSWLGGKLSGAKERIVPLSRLQEERLREPAPSRAEP